MPMASVTDANAATQPRGRSVDLRRLGGVSDTGNHPDAGAHADWPLAVLADPHLEHHLHSVPVIARTPHCSTITEYCVFPIITLVWLGRR